MTCALQPFTEAPFSYRLRWQIVRGACYPSGYGHGCYSMPRPTKAQGPSPEAAQRQHHDWLTMQGVSPVLWARCQGGA